jgi:hypothetical protein
MKKVILILGLLAFSIAAFPCEGIWNACGAQDIQDMVIDAMSNCGPGSQFTIVDLCDGNTEGNHHQYHVSVQTIG